MSDDIEAACVNLEADWPYGNMPESLRTVIAAARATSAAHMTWEGCDLERKELKQQLAAERQAREQAEAERDALKEALRKVRMCAACYDIADEALGEEPEQ